MKVTVNQPLFSNDGKVLEDENKNVITLKEILMKTALYDLEKEDKAKLEDFNLFLNLKGSKDDAEITSSEIVRLLEKSKKLWGILIYGQLNALLEGKENPLKFIKDVE